MVKIFTIVLAMVMLTSSNAGNNRGMDIAWFNATEEQRFNMPMEYKAHAVGLTVEEFEFMARVIEAESDRSNDIEGRIYIAATIFNRMYDSRFPDTITGVLTESGQFATVSGGWCSLQSTDLSEWAIIEAQRQLVAGTIPSDILFFNCIGYNNGTPFGYIGGNYFMQA